MEFSVESLLESGFTKRELRYIYNNIYSFICFVNYFFHISYLMHLVQRYILQQFVSNHLVTLF